MTDNIDAELARLADAALRKILERYEALEKGGGKGDEGKSVDPAAELQQLGRAVTVWQQVRARSLKAARFQPAVLPERSDRLTQVRAEMRAYLHTGLWPGGNTERGAKS